MATSIQENNPETSQFERTLAGKVKSYAYWRKMGCSRADSFKTVMCGTDWTKEQIAKFDELTKDI